MKALEYLKNFSETCVLKQKALESLGDKPEEVEVFMYVEEAEDIFPLEEEDQDIHLYAGMKVIDLWEIECTYPTGDHFRSFIESEPTGKETYRTIRKLRALVV